MKKAALLPDSHIATNRISQLAVGESGWTVPWAMDVDENRRCWLNPSYTVDPHPGGTMQLLIKRLADGYEVWLPDDYTWRPGDDRQPNWLPVIRVNA